MARNQRAVSIRFNMDDMADRELYRKLAEGAGDSASMAAYVKRALEERFALDIKVADRREFHGQMLEAVREEMQSQGMKLVGALLAGIGAAGSLGPREGSAADGLELPEACGELPEELQGILDYIG